MLQALDDIKGAGVATGPHTPRYRAAVEHLRAQLSEMVIWRWAMDCGALNGMLQALHADMDDHGCLAVLGTGKEDLIAE